MTRRCPIWDIRYVEWREDEYHVWLVDYDGVPFLLHSRSAYGDPDFTPSHWISYDPYRCAGCQQWFRSWRDVWDHLAPFEDAFEIRRIGES